jgi:hypothetical protein
MQCWTTGGCDLEGRREFVQLLLDHDERLLAASPDLTPEEQDWYRAETTAGDANRLRAAFQSNVGSRVSIRGTVRERGLTLRSLKAVLAPPIDPATGQPIIPYDELWGAAVQSWVLLGQNYADSTWVLAWDRVRNSQPVPVAQSSSNTLESDLQSCGLTAQAILQIAYDDLEKENP